MAADSERQLFASEVLSAVGGQSAQLPQTEVTGFLAMAGHSYAKALMVVGRAVNGWAEGVLPSGLASPSGIERYAALVQTSVSGNGDCPMQWVTKYWGRSSGGGYSTKRSAFWRAIRGVVDALGIASVDSETWPSHLVWSNLYKVSPANGGNPSDALCDVQLSGCIRLLRLELATYNPSRLLFLTGINWARPFLTLLEGSMQDGAGLRHVERFGTCCLADGKPVQCVVAVHPQGKPGGQWVQEVVNAYDR